MRKYENCIIKCKNKVALKNLYNKLTEIGVEEFKSELYDDTEYDNDRIDGIYNSHYYDSDKEIWLLIEYQDYGIGAFPEGYLFQFTHSDKKDKPPSLEKWQISYTTKLEEISYHTFFRKEKINELLKK